MGGTDRTRQVMMPSSTVDALYNGSSSPYEDCRPCHQEDDDGSLAGRLHIAIIELCPRDSYICIEARAFGKTTSRRMHPSAWWHSSQEWHYRNGIIGMALDYSTYLLYSCGPACISRAWGTSPGPSGSLAHQAVRKAHLARRVIVGRCHCSGPGVDRTTQVQNRIRNICRCSKGRNRRLAA